MVKYDRPGLVVQICNPEAEAGGLQIQCLPGLYNIFEGSKSTSHQVRRGLVMEPNVERWPSVCVKLCAQSLEPQLVNQIYSCKHTLIACFGFSSFLTPPPPAPFFDMVCNLS